MKNSLLTLLFLISTLCFSQEKIKSPNYDTKEVAVNSLLKGTLYTPVKASKKLDLVILIAGSGPTDRDGNQKGMTNNSLKFLSQELAVNNLAVFSYDKRIFAQMAAGTLNESSLSFEDFINDAKDVIQFFKDQKKFNKIIVAGHSEGALVGMVAAQDNVDAYISLAGAGRPIDAVIVEQIEKQAPFLKDEVQKNLELLKSGTTFELKNKMLVSLFRESVQPYMISWIKYNPQNEIKKLQVPVLIINGTKDLQVKVSEADLLKFAKPEATLILIDNMNHVFKSINGDDSENMKSYTDDSLPVSDILVKAITQFTKAL